MSAVRLPGNAAPGWRSGKHAALLLDFRRIKVLQYELGGEIATEIIERLEAWVRDAGRQTPHFKRRGRSHRSGGTPGGSCGRRFHPF